MKAMILAAGLGTRLRPLTADRPKALVTVAGQTMLQIALKRLRTFGVREVMINTHYRAEMIQDYLDAHDNFGISIEISREEILLDTGGGLKRAAWFFLRGDSLDEPFILHNVDVISTIDLARMVQFHVEQDALASLAVQDRVTSRYLLFDVDGRLCGRRTRSGAKKLVGSPQDVLIQSAGKVNPLAFSGIHVISPRLLTKLTEEGAFSIISAYLRLAAQQEKIVAFRADQFYWRDLGRSEDLMKAESDLAAGIYK